MQTNNRQPIRIIPRLDIKGSNLVKGIRLEGLRVMGLPEIFAKYYYENGADELFFQDVVASLYERNSLTHIIEKVAKEVFIPLTVGGGIRSLDNIYKILRSGADKVSINTAALADPNFIKLASRNFGSSTISVSIEAIKQLDGRYLAFSDNGRNCSNKELLEWSKQIEDLGAGEIILTLVDKEGTGEGYDNKIIEIVSGQIKIPLVIHGGTGRKEHALNLLSKINLSGIAIASMFHYEFLDSISNTKVQKNEYDISNIKNIYPCSINQLKTYLSAEGLICRSNVN